MVDTSALIAVLNREADAERFIQAFHLSEALVISMATILEAHCVASRDALPQGQTRLRRLIVELNPEASPFDELQLVSARQAYARYGRGSGHRAKLNMGDCFSYALAKTRGLPLLFKGGDFIHTDIEPALTPG
ncbi:type II toxin-antitoxin system VapC family toxin [Mesorhizobium xinjiangense]|uniref:type II toxin-antitoxin system VapC family toxin n=1 Tax=Mesorhizobium xinjiangense TaxID=2678685 RepID=UPI002E263E2B